jgi:hypothetical protein
VARGGDPGRAHWLKAVGHAGGPLPERWLEDGGNVGILQRSGFPRRPRIAPGDRLVLYAAVWKRVFGVVEAASEPVVRDHPRWPWVIDVEPLLVVPRLGDAPPVEAIGVAPRSMSQQSHIALTPEGYGRAVAVLASIASSGQ